DVRAVFEEMDDAPRFGRQGEFRQRKGGCEWCRRRGVGKGRVLACPRVLRAEIITSVPVFAAAVKIWAARTIGVHRVLEVRVPPRSGKCTQQLSLRLRVSRLSGEGVVGGFALWKLTRLK